MVRDIVTIFGVITGLTYYILTVRSQRAHRKMMLYLPVYTRFQEKEFMKDYCDILFNWEWKDWNDFQEKYGGNLEAIGQWASVTSYFHCVGSLIMRNELDTDLVSDLMQNTSIMLWEKVEPIVNSYRVSLDHPRYVQGYEYLYNMMKERAQFEQKT
jgi:hypothetical protein